MLIISIDPGLINLAVILAHFDIDTGVFTVKDKHLHHVINSDEPLDLKDLQLKIGAIYSEIQVNLAHSAITESWAQEPVIILIEKQYFVPSAHTFWLSIKLQTVQCCLYWMASNTGFDLPYFICSSAYKKALKISAGDHAKNKKLAVEYAKQKGAQTSIHHYADCYNQAIWYIWKFYNVELETITINE